ncbi:MAG TPA: alpha/beta hydrolase [Microthrixaceae bacterium]|nr:alpha/beta hydrolase [Microthrixaceae bacterium]
MSGPLPLPVSPHRLGSTRLSDGRTVGWAEFGDPDGDAVFWFPGTPGARCQVPDDITTEATRRRLRVITVERPGTGDTAVFRYERIIDFVPDFVEMVDDLGVEQFGMVGFSGGGPFVLACAHELPDRMTGGVVLAGIGPTCGADAVISHTMLLRLVGGAIRSVANPLSTAFGAFIKTLGPYAGPIIDTFFQFEVGDRTQMHTRPGTKAQLIADLSDAAHRSGIRAPFEDLILFGRHWGFELGAIRVPITFWGGTSDIIVPYTHAERQWKRVPGSSLHTMEGRGHFAGYTEVGMVLDYLREHWPAVRPADGGTKKASGKKAGGKKPPGKGAAKKSNRETA